VRFSLPPLAVVLLALAAACQPKAVATPSAEPSNQPKTGTTAQRTPAEIAASSTPSVVSVRTEHSLGTGFVVSGDGLVASNLHVIAGNSHITVTLADHREYDVVEIFSGDRERDLVIMRIEAQKLPVLALGDSNAIHPGDAIVAIGHPLGLEDTVSNGLVSAIRKLDDDLTVLQISAPIAPGSSGGPIFNDRGEVIGVATAIMMGGQNLNFGVPIAYVKELLRRPAPVNLVTFASATAEEEPSAPSGPGPKRNVPQLPVQILDGCSSGSIALMLKSIGEAIDVGAPLYNAGNFSGCYHVYEGAAADLERKLRPACQKPAKALSDGRKKAARLDNPSDQAWAMRDTFDGLLDVVRRWNGPTNKPRSIRHH
jgi:S1-C subfamily serine protease